MSQFEKLVIYELSSYRATKHCQFRSNHCQSLNDYQRNEIIAFRDEITSATLPNFMMKCQVIHPSQTKKITKNEEMFPYAVYGLWDLENKFIETQELDLHAAMNRATGAEEDFKLFCSLLLFLSCLSNLSRIY